MVISNDSFSARAIPEVAMAQVAYCHQRHAEQSLAADGAIAWFSSNLFQSGRMLIARRS